MSGGKSIASIASPCSIGSAGSILSIGSVTSILSLFSALCILGRFAFDNRNAIRRLRRPEGIGEIA